MATKKQIIAISAPVTIEAGAIEGEKKGPAKFNVLAYTGGILPGALRNGDTHEDVIMDLAGMETGKSLIANLDHEMKGRVGHVNAIGNDGKQINLSGIASASTPARDEVVNSAADGFVWQASVEANPTKLEQVKPGETVKVNGQEFQAPPRGGRALYVARTSTLKGFAFVSHGADDNTTVTIAASAASLKGKAMKTEVKAWAETMGIDVENASEETLAAIEANYEGKNGKKIVPVEGATASERRKIEAKRRTEIIDIADQWMEKKEGDLQWISAIEEVRDEFITAKKSSQEFRNELYETMVLPLAHTVPAPRDRTGGLTHRILEAAVCTAGRLPNIEKAFTDQELQAAHDHFKGRIGLKQLLVIGAQMNGYQNTSFDVSIETQRAAFAMTHPGQIRATGGFSMISLSTTLGAIANKFIRVGWNAIDMTPMRIAYIRSVNNFQQITTASLTGDLQYEKIGPDGQIKHGTLGETTYNNQADTYARMLKIDRRDIINDDLNALTQVPNRLGRGAALKLNDIFWTAFLNNSSFFSSGNSNVNTGVANMTVAGLDATETVLMNQTDPDGKPLGVNAAILLVPPALKNSAITLMGSEQAVYATSTQTSGVKNPFSGRFRVESSPYMANSSYTGYDAAAWYLLCDPNELPVIEIVALGGRVEPTVEQSDADFNELGMQMRGYSDVGCALQEKRGGVRADGGSS